MDAIKCIEVRSKMDRVRYFNAMERIRRKEQRVMRSRIRNVFNLQRMMIEDFEGDIGIQDVQNILLQTVKPMTDVFVDTYLRVADDIYPMTTKKLDRSWRPYAHLRAWDSEEDYQRAVRHWITNVCGEKITYIDNTTLRQVKKCYDKAHNQEEFRQMMVELFDNSITPFRSNAIARTETASATNRCSIETMRAADFDGYKTWFAVGDMDTRDTHMMLDGTKIGMDERFKWVNPQGIGCMMDVPCDSTYSPPASECVNCRCCVTYDFE